MSKLAVIRGFIIQRKQELDMFDTPNNLQAKVAYNQALLHLDQFIDAYEKGVLPSEYKDELLKRLEVK
jgi:hypothetical protein